MPAISAVVCTRNRAHLLDGCLGSLTAQSLAPEEFEVLVIDNGSIDRTAAVLDHWCERFANVRYEREGVPGLSRARNAGIASAHGDVVAFIDDDARATESWLASLLDAYRSRPGLAAAGGPVTLVWPSPPPAWLGPSMASWYSELDLGPARRLIGRDETLWGTNLSVRREAVAHLGGFRCQLGRVGRRLTSNDDIDLVRRLHQEGGDILYEPAAEVLHHVSADRLTRRWLLRRHYDQGRSDATMEGIEGVRPGDAPCDRRALVARAGKAMVASMAGAWGGHDTEAGTGAAGDHVLAQALWRARSLGYGREALAQAFNRR